MTYDKLVNASNANGLAETTRAASCESDGKPATISRNISTNHASSTTALKTSAASKPSFQASVAKERKPKVNITKSYKNKN
jgi:hypothetical protein